MSKERMEGETDAKRMVREWSGRGPRGVGQARQDQRLRCAAVHVAHSLSSTPEPNHFISRRTIHRIIRTNRHNRRVVAYSGPATEAIGAMESRVYIFKCFEPLLDTCHGPSTHHQGLSP